ncbi:hypothetical protein Tco_0287622 [Tanacetum coccineum]
MLVTSLYNFSVQKSYSIILDNLQYITSALRCSGIESASAAAKPVKGFLLNSYLHHSQYLLLINAEQWLLHPIFDKVKRTLRPYYVYHYPTLAVQGVSVWEGAEEVQSIIHIKAEKCKNMKHSQDMQLIQKLRDDQKCMKKVFEVMSGRNIVTNSRVTPSWREIVSLTFSEAGVLHVNWISFGHCVLRRALSQRIEIGDIGLTKNGISMSKFFNHSASLPAAVKATNLDSIVEPVMQLASVYPLGTVGEPVYVNL